MINNLLFKNTKAQLFFISVVLVFSQCSIRKLLEESYNFQSLSISSKHQNTENISSICNDEKIKKLTNAKLEIPKNKRPATISFSKPNLSFPQISEKALSDNIKSNFKAIPYYILYQNMRCYIS